MNKMKFYIIPVQNATIFRNFVEFIRFLIVAFTELSDANPAGKLKNIKKFTLSYCGFF